MDAVEIIDEPCCEKAVTLREEVATYTEQAFKMFGGQLEDVVLEFHRSLIGVVYDKFGESVKMLPSGENKCIATVKVRISPTFWGWIFQFGAQMQILSPGRATNEYQNKLNALICREEE
jgi:predicted DNA-binding transcriptional regulator YafY